MAYKVIILYQLYMPSYFLGTFTEYPYLGIYRILANQRQNLGVYYSISFSIPAICSTFKSLSLLLEAMS